MSAKLTTTQKVTFLPDINKPGQEQTSPWSRMQKKGKETETAQPAKSQTPTVSKDEIALFRNSVRQNACVEMLRGGFHRSFSELFSLLQRWKEIRLAAGPGSAIWQHKSLEEQPAKLHTLRHYLTKAETALRAGAWSAVYDQQVFLAQYFREPEDRWLSCHFYQTSLNSARRVKIDGGRKEAEALANMGQVYMEQGQLDSAREQYECFYQLTAGRAWRSEGGRSLHCQACEGLWRVYTQLAERPLQANDYRAAIDTLSKAFQMAKEAGDHRIEGEAAYRVGLAYQCVGDQVTAKRFLNMYMEMSTALGDAGGLGKAYKAIAKSLESEGKLSETVQYLEKFAEVSQGNNQYHNLEEACMCLGVIFNSRGQYERGCTYFERGYEIARDLEEVPLLQRAQVFVGSARAYSMIRKYSRSVETASHSDLLLLTAWKESRQNVFTDTTGSAEGKI
ncbi:tetratricopeptide repeat protein 29 isoform X1 [Oncorhynchus kisutch]|uniref:Tetratricopeptide repeat protein 29 n=1 Tax=Oncorhynchus kisutch TaxID=8019 RepID=A0A8C7FR85_ONCKI|nr:tetratricopeptide repeat protein 29 isoform X1 [Oncorhynchus kisutch]